MFFSVHNTKRPKNKEILNDFSISKHYMHDASRKDARMSFVIKSFTSLVYYRNYEKHGCNIK